MSDLHSNAEALRAVLSHVRRKKFDFIACLGDFVGYGAEPNQVLDVMRTMKASKLYIRGNHDRVVAGREEMEQFNAAAKTAALWTRDHLSAPNGYFFWTGVEGYRGSYLSTSTVSASLRMVDCTASSMLLEERQTCASPTKFSWMSF